MSTNRGRSLSERLDRDGPESALRRAREIGGDAPAIAADFVALHRKFEALRVLTKATNADAASRLDKVVASLMERVEAAGEEEEISIWRRPAFPQTEEETRAMAMDEDEETSQSPGEAGVFGSVRGSVPAQGAGAGASLGVQRAKEASPADSGLVNLKALAEDYFRTRASRPELVTRPPAGVAAATSPVAPSPARRRAVGPLVAIAAGLLAVLAVVVYVVVMHRTADEKTPRVPGGAVVAAGPAVVASESRGSAEEVERYRRELEQLRQQLAQVERDRSKEAAAVVPGAPEAHAAVTGPGRAERSKNLVVSAAPPRRAGSGSAGSAGGASRSVGTPGAAASQRGTVPSAAGAGTPPVPPPLIDLLAGRTPDEAAAGSDLPRGGSATPGAASGGRSGPATPSSDRGTQAAGDSRLAGSLADLAPATPSPGRTAGAPPTPAARPPVGPAAGAPLAPPSAPPPEETLPDTLGRAEMRQGIDSVRDAILRCGASHPGSTIRVEFTVNGSDGSVKSARVTGEFAGTAVGACAEAAAREARFPRFRRPTFTFQFPFMVPVR